MVSIKKFVNFLRQHLRWKPFYTYVALENFWKISRTATFSDCLENLEAAPLPHNFLPKLRLGFFPESFQKF